MRVGARIVIAATLCTPLALHALQVGTSTPNTPAIAEVTFQFDRTGVPVPHFTLQVRQDGTGRYQADQAARSSSDPSRRGENAQHIDRTLVLSSAMTAKIFTAVRAANYFQVTCASKAKNIADTGTKVLSYSGVEGAGSCVYNYTENKSASMLTDIFLGIANTMDEGRKLDFLHRYDRLGLDAEMESFFQEVEDGHALELGTISPTLSAIASDPEVIQRVRLRAARMLEQVGNTP